ncbi:MAG: hypothetical protein QM495_08865 [Lutibacter sp.]|uniref:hypothetical protein n=1 Tax=Lutibacter sp. TaxID=1925666 RepID=UPI00385C7170
MMKIIFKIAFIFLIILSISCKEKDNAKPETKNGKFKQTEKTIDFSKIFKDKNQIEESNIKISDSIYYEFYNQILRGNVTIIGRELLSTKIDTITLKELIEFSNNPRMDSRKILLFNNYIKNENIEKLNLSEKDLVFFLKQSDLKDGKLKQSELLKNKVINEKEYEKIEKDFDLNDMSSSEIGPFCKIYKPIFSNDLSIAIFKYDYIPFPREFSSGTYLFIKENEKWKVVTWIGFYEIS